MADWVKMKVVLKKSLLVALALAVVGLPAARGDERARRDANERGSQMQLDVARIKHGHRRVDKSRLLLHRIRFQEDVESREFYQGMGGVQLLFSTDDDRAEERAIRFVLNPDGSVAAKMYRPGPKVVGYANWWRSDARTVKVEFSRSSLGRRLNVYKWRVFTAQDAPCEPEDPNGGLQADGCFDGTRWLTHRI